MKKQTLTTMTAIALLAMGVNAQDSGAEMKAHIIHHSGSQVQMYDTLFGPSDNYSIEQFLQDKGFDPAKTEIIRTEGTGEQGVWVMDSEGQNTFTWEISEDGESGTQSVFIHKECTEIDGDDPRKKKMKVIRQGEGGEDIQIDVSQISNVDWKKVVEETGGEGEMNVKVIKLINDDGEEEKRVWINGEEVDPEHAAGNQFFQDEEGEQHVAEVRILGGEGDAEVHRKREVIVIRSDETELPEGATIETLFETTEGSFGEPFTIAILAELPPSDDLPSSNGDELGLRIVRLQFFPNPNEGKFNLQFELPQSGETQIEIFSTSGQRVYSKDLGTFSGEFRGDIDISEQPAGTYILHITQAGKQLAEKVIVK